MSLSISLLGTFQAAKDNIPITAFATDRTRALLIYLAVEADRPHRREALAGLLWPETPEKAALTNLRQSLARLRRAIGDHDASPPYLIITPQTIQFNSEAATLDVTLFQNLLAACEAHVHSQIASCLACIQRLSQAMALYRGQFLEGFFLKGSQLFEEWALFKQEQLHRQALDVLQIMITYHIAQADYSQASAYIEQQLTLDPWREDARRHLMSILVTTGQRNAALVQFESCRAVLAAELGVEPHPDTLALYEQIKAGTFDADAWKASVSGSVPDETDATSPATRSRRQDWGDAPHLPTFYGRQAELALLSSWLVTDQARLIAILGMGGMGKTALAAKVCYGVTEDFDCILWRSLLNAPSLRDTLHIWLQWLSNHQLSQPPDSLDEQLDLLFSYLRQQRCLLVLDNVESIMQGGDRAGLYRRGYEEYGQLMKRLGESEHRSCLLLTSRECPKELQRLEREVPLVHSLPLTGMEEIAGAEILIEQGVGGTKDERATLISYYSGNPLALKLVADTIQDIFSGDITAFLRQTAPIFDDIRDVLDEQFARLFPLEQEILIWLAIEREPVSLQTIEDDLLQPPSQGKLLEAISSLQRRSLLERAWLRGIASMDAIRGYALQNVVTEYVTDRVIEQAYREIMAEEINLLHRHSLLKSQAKEYVRESQLRLLLRPLGERLLASLGRSGLEAKLKHLLENLRGQASRTPSYAGGNILNLLLALKIDVRGYDFSQLAVWQAYLRGIDLPEINLSHSDLTASVFTDAFGFVLSVALSPDGQLLAASTGDGQVRLWQMANGQPYSSFRTLTNFINSIAFSPDGNLLAAGSGDQLVRLWEVSSEQLRRVLRGHSLGVISVAFSPDGQMLASGSEAHTVCLWDLHTGQMLATLVGHGGPVFCVVFSPDGETLATSGTSTLKLWNPHTREQTRVLEGHTGQIRGLAFESTGNILISGGEDGTIRFWNARTGKSLRVLQRDEVEVWSIAISPDGETLAVGTADWLIRLWNIQTGQVVHTLEGHRQIPRSLAFTPDGRILASGSEDRTVRLWDAYTGQALQTFQGYTAWIRSVAWSGPADNDQDQVVVSGGEDQAVRVWDVRERRLRDMLRGHERRVWCVAVSPDGQMAASGSEDFTTRLWDLRSRQPVHILREPTRRVWSVAFSPDGKIVASGSDHPTVHLWDVCSGKLVQKLVGHTSWVFSVSFSPDDNLLASTGADRSVIVWNLHSGRPLHIVRGHEQRVWAVTFSADGALLASAGEGLTIRLWDAASGRLLRTLDGHERHIRSLACGTSDHILASGSEDGTVRVWDMQTGETLQILRGHTQGVRSVTFSPDGNTLASGSYDETIRLWDIRTGQCLDTLRVEGPYAGMNISGARGLTDAQRRALITLGAMADET